MSPKRHRYEVTEITADVSNVEVGTILVDKNHHPKQDEPHRVWEFASMKTGQPTGYIVAKYLGPHEEISG